MSKKIKTQQSLVKIRRIHRGMVFAFTAVIILSILAVTRLAIDKTDTVLKNKVISMTSSLNVQMKLNVDSYISRMENLAMLAFGEKLAYTYDATDPDNDEYEAINTEKVITDKLFSLCIMENFVDYGIVYRNNRTVGKISNGTSSLFGEKMYSELESMISRPRTDDGWFTGYSDDYRRIYYVKRVHENAVLFISFYANELNYVFDNPETLSDMEIRLVDSNYNMIFSKSGEQLGSALPSDIAERIGGQSSASVMDNKYLVSVNRSGDWYVICSIPTKIILDEKNEMTMYIYMAGVVVAVLAILLGIYISRLLINSANNVLYVLDDKAKIDQLTAVYNKKAFEELSGTTLENSLTIEPRALVIFDLDDFKSVNDGFGHAAGDRVLESTGRILKETFSDDDYVGRIGGDEFCVLVNTNCQEPAKLKTYVEERCDEFGPAFSESKTAKNIGAKVSASIGVAIFPTDGRSFTELYAAADKALYSSKKHGKNTVTFYSAEQEVAK